MPTRVRSVTFMPDRDFERRQALEAEAKRYMGDVAAHIVDRAVANYPGGFMGSRRKLRATKDGEITGGAGWHLVEFGSVNNSPRAPIRRAVESLGMKIEHK